MLPCLRFTPCPAGDVPRRLGTRLAFGTSRGFVHVTDDLQQTARKASYELFTCGLCVLASRTDPKICLALGAEERTSNCLCTLTRSPAVLLASWKPSNPPCTQLNLRPDAARENKLSPLPPRPCADATILAYAT